MRSLAATNRDLKALVDKGTFREDLYYRLSVFPIVIPPLRDRKDDIPKLVESFLGELNRKYSNNKTLTQMALGRLLSYNWPGNVRELKNVLERAFIMSDGEAITAGDLGVSIRPNSREDRAGAEFNLKEHLEQIEAEYIRSAYEAYHNIRAAARSLDMDPATYLRKRKKYEELYPARGE